jgi:hypothetical protein
MAEDTKMPSEMPVDASTENRKHHEELFQMPIQDRIARVVRHSLCHTLDFLHIGDCWDRADYIRTHQTPICALMCMDGCISISRVTKVPWGIIQPFRNLGGRFDLKWSHLGELLAESILEETKKGGAVLCLVVYHFSKSDPHHGCTGFDVDTEAARVHAFTVARQLDRSFGQKRNSVYPLVVGLETDEEALLFHDVEGKEVLDLSAVPRADECRLATSLRQLYPDMPEYVTADLLPLITGTLSHTADLKRRDRSITPHHHEWIICVGRGFDWLLKPDQALIIGPYSPDLSEPLHTAISTIESNMRNGRIPEDGFLLLTEAPYRQCGKDRARAELESRYLAELAADIIRERHPYLAHKMHIRSTISSKETHGVTLVESLPQSLTNQASAPESYATATRRQH